jgi:DNA-binding transcriptional LysR family regulator
LGREVLVSAERIWAEFEHISGVRAVRKTKSSIAFTVEGIGAAPYLTQFVIAPAFASLQGAGLLQKARVAELPVERLVLSGLSGHIDVAVHTGELGFPKTWLTEKVGVIEWRLYGASARFKSAKVSKSDLEKLSFVYPVFWSQEGLRDGDRDFPHAPIVRDKCIGVTSAYAAVELIRTTSMVSYLPEVVVERLGAKDLRRLHIDDEIVMKDDLWMTFRADALTKRTVASLVTAMRGVLGA